MNACAPGAPPLGRRCPPPKHQPSNITLPTIPPTPPPTHLSQLDAEKERYAQHARIRGLLASVAEELPDVPLYYSLHDLCKTVRCTAPKAQAFRSALLNAG